MKPANNEKAGPNNSTTRLNNNVEPSAPNVVAFCIKNRPAPNTHRSATIMEPIKMVGGGFERLRRFDGKGGPSASSSVVSQAIFVAAASDERCLAILPCARCDGSKAISGSRRLSLVSVAFASASFRTRAQISSSELSLITHLTRKTTPDEPLASWQFSAT